MAAKPTTSAKKSCTGRIVPTAGGETPATGKAGATTAATPAAGSTGTTRTTKSTGSAAPIMIAGHAEYSGCGATMPALRHSRATPADHLSLSSSRKTATWLRATRQSGDGRSFIHFSASDKLYYAKATSLYYATVTYFFSLVCL